MIDLLKLLFGLVPVVVFLGVLIMYDSFKLVNFKSILKTLIYGGFSAFLCLFLNQWLMAEYNISLLLYSRYGAPLVEEMIKGMLIIYLIRSTNIGFMVDAAIFGFAIGTGFAIIENIHRFQYSDLNIFVWILRGLGTAVMHGATTAIFAVVSKYLVDRHLNMKVYIFLPGLILAILIHSFFNHLPIDPEFITIIQLIVLPLLFWAIFRQSEKALNRWLEMGLDTEVGLLEFLISGTISETKVGEYLDSLKKAIPGEKIADLICYLRIYLELSIRAKGILLMQQNGFKITLDQDVKEKLDEFKFLETSIGKTGKRALSVIFRADPKELWQIFLLYSK